MKTLKIGDSVWHPCAYDVIEHKITGIRQYKDHVVYETRSVRSVGASHTLFLLLSHIENKIIFTGYVNGEDSVEYESGLMDFVDGYYYTNETEAKVKHLDIQLTLHLSSMNQKKRLYEQSKVSFGKINKLTQELKESLKEIKKLKDE